MSYLLVNPDFPYSHVVVGNGRESSDNGEQGRRPGKIYSACAISDGMAYNGAVTEKILIDHTLPFIPIIGESFLIYLLFKGVRNTANKLGIVKPTSKIH